MAFYCEFVREFGIIYTVIKVSTYYKFKIIIIKMKALKIVSEVLLVVGGLNWLLVGLFSWDVGMIFGGQGALISRIVYILVGLSAIYFILTAGNCCKKEATVSHTPVEPQM